MQQWLEATCSSQNTYSRPSRRGQYADFVRLGKQHEGYTLHIVLDTSGSMTEELSKILGVIGAFVKQCALKRFIFYNATRL